MCFQVCWIAPTRPVRCLFPLRPVYGATIPIRQSQVILGSCQRQVREVSNCAKPSETAQPDACDTICAAWYAPSSGQPPCQR